VPDDVLQYWRETFKMVVEDPDFIQSATLAGYLDQYGYAGGDEISQTIRELGKLPDDVKKILKAIAPQ
jgi:tripartite-type tricarboxylate transporter receptor subunit TctC